MKPPDPVFFSKKPLTIKCPACSAKFVITSFTGGTTDERIANMQKDYEQHFISQHAREDASQAAVRIVREATKEK